MANPSTMRSTGGERRQTTGASGMPTSDQSYRARSARPEYVSWFGAPQEQQAELQQPSRHFYSMGSSPVAITPSFSTLSPLFPPQAQSQHSSPPSASSASAAAAQRDLDEEIGQTFTRYLPTFFDLLEKYQYQKALMALNDDEETEWKSWPVLLVMLKLTASCESTYHLMKYLEPDLVETDTIEQMYGKLVMLMNHLAEELKPLVARQIHHFPMLSGTPTPSGNGNGNRHSHSQQNGSVDGGEDNQDGSEDYDPMLMMEIAMCGDMSYYAELLEQSAEFFSLRVPMLQFYRGLARSTVPRDYHRMLKRLENLLMRFDAFDHPLLETMKQSAIEELSTVHAAIQCEARVAEYDFTRSIVALHRLKVQLRSWSDHIDSVSDYPLFEGGGALGDEDDEGQLLLDESDDNYGTPPDSVYSGASYSNHSSASMARTQQPYTLASSMSTDSLVGGTGGIGAATIPGADVAPGAPRPLTGSLISHRAGRYVNMGDTSFDIADETNLLEKKSSRMSLDSVSSPVSSETPSTITRLLSQSSLLRRGGLLASALPIRRGLVQKPGDPYISSGDGTSLGPTNTLEQVILGGGGNGAAGGGANNGNGSGLVNPNDGNGGSNNPLAAEMMASSMKKLERDDGFALPVFQWSKRFYRSLVAKFSLYFHHWLDPFEKKSDYLSLELTRFIRTPLGISYLQLMDVLLARGSHRGNEGKTRIMLILETQQLENKGAHYYENGYRCPSSSKARYSRTDQEAQDDQEEQDAKQKAIDSPSGTGCRMQSPAASVASRGAGSSSSPMNDVRRRSADQQTNHALFMRIDKEQNEEQNDFSELWGLRSWPAIFCYPDSSPPLEHWPNIVSLIMDNRAALDSVHPAFTHVERRMKVTYHITRVDAAMFLVLLVEGSRRPNEKVAQDFMETVTENLQHSGAFEPRVLSEEAAARVAATNL